MLQVKDLHKDFMETCPNGLMSRAKFVELSQKAIGEKAVFLSDALFR